MGVSEEVFERIVNDTVVAILSRLEFTVRKESKWDYRAESKSVEVSIGYNYNSIRVMLRQKSSVPEEEQDFVELHFMLESLAPELPEAEQYPKDMTWASNSMIQEEVNRQLNLLVNYCQPLLLNDHAVWLKVKKFVQDWWEFRYQKENESRDDFADRIRKAANESLQREYYWTALDLYNRIPGDYLTREDRKMRQQAEKYTFPIR